jgi:hypothetical protein
MQANESDERDSPSLDPDMNSKAILRLCLVCVWVCIAAEIALSFVLERSLPEPLQAWVGSEAERELTAVEVGLIVPFVSLLTAMIVATVGLFRHERWASWVYLAAAAVGILLTPYTGPNVEHALTATVSGIGSVLDGMVIALAFFSNALEKKPVGSGVKVVRAIPVRSV